MLLRSSALACPIALVVSACGPQTEPDPPSAPLHPGGTGGAAVVNSGPDASNPPPPACVTFTFTTLDNQGRYSPNNVSAVWVMDGSGKFIRTLEENGYIRESHLGRWESVSAGNTVDAVTGATNRAPRQHTVAWDCTGLDQQPLPDGNYEMDAEFTTSNTGGFFGGQAPLLQVPFALGKGAGTITVPDQQYFVGISLTTTR